SSGGTGSPKSCGCGPSDASWHGRVNGREAARPFYTVTVWLAVEREHRVFVQFEGFAIAGDEAIGGRRRGDRRPARPGRALPAGRRRRGSARQAAGQGRGERAAPADAVRQGDQRQGPGGPDALPARARQGPLESTGDVRHRTRPDREWPTR